MPDNDKKPFYIGAIDEGTSSARFLVRFSFSFSFNFELFCLLKIQNKVHTIEIYLFLITDIRCTQTKSHNIPSD